MSFEAKTPPIVFNPNEPLIIRPLKPHGFALETSNGQTLMSFAVDYTECTFRVSPLPETPDTCLIEMSWIEI